MKMNKTTGIEIIAVVLLTVGRAIANNLAVIYWLGYPPVRPFGYYQFTESLRGLYLIGLVLFIVSLKKESWTELGLLSRFWIRDVAIALCLIFTTMLIWMPFASLIEKLGLFVFQKPPSPFVHPSTTGEVLWICISCIFVGFGEELLIRGYLLSRLLRVCGAAMSVIYSSLVFSAWHTSQGVFSVAYSFIFGLVYGWTFTRLRRLYPLALAHAINDMIGFLWV
jgi:membrane protease YdiL (CAAX protease family)